MFLTLYIERSRPEQSLELKLSNLVMHWEPDATLIGLLAAAMTRTRWLSLAPHLLNRSWSPWRLVLRNPALALEVAILHVQHSPSPYRSSAVLPDSEDIFGGQSPNLRQLTLSGAFLPPSSCPALLVNLRYFEWMQYGAEIDTTMFCQILAFLPRLEGFSLYAMSFSWDSSIYLKNRLGSHPLRHLKIDGQSGSNIVGCLKDLAIQCFAHRLPYPPTTTDALLDWSSSASLGLHICEFIAHPPWTDKPLTARLLPLMFGNDSDCVDQNVGFLPYVVRGSFASVTTLSIHEFLWPVKVDPGHPVQFPALRSLRIALASSHVYRTPPYYYEAGLLTPLDARAVFHAPALHTLSLDHAADCEGHPPPSAEVYPYFHYPHGDNGDELSKGAMCTCDKVLYVSLRDVHHLITTLVTGWHPRLPLLTMSHVEAIDLDAQACEQLIHSIAEEVVMSPNSARPNNSDTPDYIWREQDSARIFQESLI